MSTQQNSTMPKRFCVFMFQSVSSPFVESEQEGNLLLIRQAIPYLAPVVAENTFTLDAIEKIDKKNVLLQRLQKIPKVSIIIIFIS